MNKALSSSIQEVWLASIRFLFSLLLVHEHKPALNGVDGLGLLRVVFFFFSPLFALMFFWRGECWR